MNCLAGERQKLRWTHSPGSEGTPPACLRWPSPRWRRGWLLRPERQTGAAASGRGMSLETVGRTRKGVSHLAAGARSRRAHRRCPVDPIFAEVPYVVSVAKPHYDVLSPVPGIVSYISVRFPG
jgi:hypothetical protein